jgi:probable F420-dependent oxidoreductase
VSRPALGLAIGGSLADVARQARLAEEAGFESAWVAELERSAIVQAAAAIGATSRIRVGTAAALAFPRSPTIVAMEARDLDELSGGRFLLGLGTQVRAVLERRFSVPFASPAARLVEYAAAVRTVWAAGRGEARTHEGEFYRITMPTFHGERRDQLADPRILFAAVGPVMARAAGEVADGLLGHPLASPRYLAEVVAPSVAAGLSGASRPPAMCPITATAIVSIDPDRDVARARARLQIGFYATTRTYRRILEIHERGSLIADLRRAFARGDDEALAALVDDDLVDAIAIAGTPAEAADALERWAVVPGLERVILAPPWYRVDDADVDALVDAIVAAFGSTSSA